MTQITGGRWDCPPPKKAKPQKPAGIVFSNNGVTVTRRIDGRYNVLNEQRVATGLDEGRVIDILTELGIEIPRELR